MCSKFSQYLVFGLNFFNLVVGSTAASACDCILVSFFINICLQYDILNERLKSDLIIDYSATTDRNKNSLNLDKTSVKEFVVHHQKIFE